jgi:hypothetical protein
VCNTNKVARTTGRDNSDSPRYFVSTKHGWQRYMPPTGDSPFAVMIKGELHLIHRAVTDAEFFATHPDAGYRMTARPLRPADPWIFRVRITTPNDGGVHTGCDSADVYGALNHVGGGSRREMLTAAARQMLGNPSLNMQAA